jgi:restriction endonuclease S subunit
MSKSRFVEMFGSIQNSRKYPYKTVKEFTKVISGGTPNRALKEYWEGGTIPWVKTTELQNNVITEVEESITNEGLSNSSAKIVPAETVLIAMYGQGKTRGMTAILGLEACTNQACACILPSEKINQTYLWQFFMLSYDHLRSMAKGGNQPNLNSDIIKNYPILYPPKERQNEFAAFVRQTNKSKFAIQQSITELETLKKALMQQYFG